MLFFPPFFIFRFRFIASATLLFSFRLTSQMDGYSQAGNACVDLCKRLARHMLVRDCDCDCSRLFFIHFK
jgi:hypothetical protein